MSKREEQRSFSWWAFAFLFGKRHSILQCHFNAYYLELGQFSQVKVIIFHKITLSTDISHKHGGSQATCTSDKLDTNSGVPTILSGSAIYYNDSQNSGKHYTHNYIFIIVKDANQNQQKKRPTGQVLEGSQIQSFCILRMHHPLDISMCITKQGTSPKLWAASFYWHFITRTWLIDSWATWLISASNPTPLRRRQADTHVAQSSNPLITGLFFLARPAPILKLFRGPP